MCVGVAVGDNPDACDGYYRFFVIVSTVCRRTRGTDSRLMMSTAASVNTVTPATRAARATALANPSALPPAE